MKFGNEWKDVQDYVKTRSSAQARSHAQKFFMKIKKCKVFDCDDVAINIDTLSKLMKELPSEKFSKKLKLLLKVTDLKLILTSIVYKRSLSVSLYCL